LRGSPVSRGVKGTSCFFFQAIRPEAIASAGFADATARDANVKAVIADILAHGNEGAMLPGQLEARAAEESARVGGLIFSEAEAQELVHVAREAGVAGAERSAFGIV
jgi:L-2-hydroxycarboxylate dehydrogenase (NAD+)